MNFSKRAFVLCLVFAVSVMLFSFVTPAAVNPPVTTDPKREINTEISLQSAEITADTALDDDPCCSLDKDGTATISVQINVDIAKDGKVRWTRSMFAVDGSSVSNAAGASIAATTSGVDYAHNSYTTTWVISSQYGAITGTGTRVSQVVKQTGTYTVTFYITPTGKFAPAPFTITMPVFVTSPAETASAFANQSAVWHDNSERDERWFMGRRRFLNGSMTNLSIGEVLYYPFDYFQYGYLVDESFAGKENAGQTWNSERFGWLYKGVLPGAAVFDHGTLADRNAGNFTAIDVNVLRGDLNGDDGVGPITLSTWVFLAALPSDPHPIDKSMILFAKNFQLWVTREGTLQLWLKNVYNTSLTYPSQVPAVEYAGLAIDRWYYVTATYDDATTNATLYINGKQVGSGQGCRGPVQWFYDTLGPSIGGVHVSWCGPVELFPWTGMMDDFSVYNRCLSSNEVALLHRITSASLALAVSGGVAPGTYAAVTGGPGGAWSGYIADNSYWVQSGAGVALSVTNEVLVSPVEKTVCSGFIGTGSLPSTGDSNQLVIPSLMNNSALAWQWHTKYWLNLATEGAAGSINQPSSWHRKDAWATNLVLTPATGANFIQWTGDLQSSGDRFATNISVCMDQPRALVAHFSDTQGWLIVNSLYGAPNPGRGINIVAYETNTASVATDTRGSTQYVCVGWTGSGSVPATGDSTSVTFHVSSSPSTITWQWATNYYVDLQVAPGGYGSLRGTPAGWYPRGSTATVTAVRHTNSLFRGWTGSGIALAGVDTNHTLSFVVTNGVALTANFDTSGLLSVQTVYGAPAPGSTIVNYGTPVTASIPSPVYVGGTTQYVSQGWTGTGSVPASGDSSSVSFTFSQPSSLYWSKWATNYLISLSSQYFASDRTPRFGGGAIRNNRGEVGESAYWWYGRGSNLSLLAIPPPGYMFQYWTGAVCSVDANIELGAVTTPTALIAVFALDSDGDGMPDWWENRYGLNPYDPSDTPQSLNFNGISNLEAYLQYGTSFFVRSVTNFLPSFHDRDGDGLSDEDERLFFGTDGSSQDTDGDGVADGDELLLYGTDPSVADTDGGGLPDGYERFCRLDPLNPADDTSPCPMVTFTVGGTTFSVPITACSLTSAGYVFVGAGGGFSMTSTTCVVSNQWSYLQQYQSGRDADGDGLVDAPGVASHVVPLAGYQSCWLPTNSCFAFVHADLAGFCRNEPVSNTTYHVDSNGDGFSDPMEIFAGASHTTSNRVAAFTNQYAVLAVSLASPALGGKWGVHMGTPDNRVLAAAAETSDGFGYACVPQAVECTNLSFTLAYTRLAQQGSSYAVNFTLAPAGGAFDWVIDPAVSDPLSGAYPTGTNALVRWGFTRPTFTMSPSDSLTLNCNTANGVNNGAQITITLAPSNAPNGFLTLSAASLGTGRIQLYSAASCQPAQEIILPCTWSWASAIPTSIWVRGLTPSSSNHDVTLMATYSNALLSAVRSNALPITVVDASVLWAHKYAIANSTNSDGTAQVCVRVAPVSVPLTLQIAGPRIVDPLELLALSNGVYLATFSNLPVGDYAISMFNQTVANASMAFVQVDNREMPTYAGQANQIFRDVFPGACASARFCPTNLTGIGTKILKVHMQTVTNTESVYNPVWSFGSLIGDTFAQISANTPNNRYQASWLLPRDFGLGGPGTWRQIVAYSGESWPVASVTQVDGNGSGSNGDGGIDLLGDGRQDPTPAVVYPVYTILHNHGSHDHRGSLVRFSSTDYPTSTLQLVSSPGNVSTSNIVWSVGPDNLGSFFGSHQGATATFVWSYTSNVAGAIVASCQCGGTNYTARMPFEIVNNRLSLTPSQVVIPTNAPPQLLAFPPPELPYSSIISLNPSPSTFRGYTVDSVGIQFNGSNSAANKYVFTAKPKEWCSFASGCATVYVCNVALDAAQTPHACNRNPGAVVLRSASTSDCSRLLPLSLVLQPAAIPFGSLALDLSGATTNYLIWTNSAKLGAAFNTSTNWPAMNFPSNLYVEGVAASSVARDLAISLSYWTNNPVGTPVVTDLLYTTVMDLALDAYQPDKITGLTKAARHAAGMVLSPNTVDADTNGVRDEADAVYNGAADANAMGLVIFRQMPGITNFIGLSNVYVQVGGPIRLFRPDAATQEPCLVSGCDEAGPSYLDISSQISTGDVRFLVEAQACGTATISLSLANLASDFVKVTILPVPMDSDADGICEHGGGNLNNPEVTSVDPVSLLPWTAVQLGRGSLPCGLSAAAYLTVWHVATNDATFLRQNWYNLDTQVLPDSGDGCTRVVRPNGRVVAFNAHGLPQMPDLGRTYRLVGSRAAGYTLVFASGYKHVFDAAGVLSKIEDPHGTTFACSEANWPQVSARTTASLVAAIDSPYYGTNGTLTCMVTYDTTNHLLGVSSDYTTLTCSQTNDTWYLHTVAGAAARVTAITANTPLTIRRTDDVKEVWTFKGMAAICTRADAATHFAIARGEAGDRIWQISRIGAYSGGMAEIATTFGFQTNLASAGFGQVRWIVAPNGGYTYQAHDSLNRVTNILYSLGSARLDRDGIVTATPPAMADCRATLFDYTGVGPDGNRDEDFNRPRTSTGYYKGTAVSREYHVYLRGAQETQVTVNPADEYGAPSNLATRITFDSTACAGFKASLVDPCGIATVFLNMPNNRGVKVAATVSGDPVGEGMVNYYDEHGWLVRTDRAQNGNPVVTLSSNLFDALGHLLATVYPDGRADTYQYNEWGVCTLSSNREGVVTTYAYDALLRMTNTVCNGIITRYANFDSFGNARTIATIGGHETSTVTRSYDTAGRLLAETAPFVGTTRYDEQLDVRGGAGSFGGHLKSVTRGAHTVTNEYFRDGTLAGTYGNSAHPVSYEYGLTNGRPFTREYQFPSLATSDHLVPLSTPTVVTTVRFSLDAAGLKQQIVFGDGSSVRTICDNNGRVTCRKDENGHRIFTAYDPAGRVSRTTLDLDNDGVAGSRDPCVEQSYAFATHHGVSVFETATYRPDTPSNTICVGRTFVRTDGQGVWSVDADNKETYAKTTYRGATRTTRIDLPTGQHTTSTFDQGVLASYKPVDCDATTTIARRDGFLRPTKVIDTKGSTTVQYAPQSSGTDYTKVTKPTGGFVKRSRDAYGQPFKHETRDGTNTLTTICDWNMTGEPIQVSGGNRQPLQYFWSGDGCFDGLATFRNFYSSSNGFTTTSDKTSWVLDPARRWPVAKHYSDGTRIQMPRDAVGNLNAWIGARSITNAYRRDAADQITGIAYSDGTPGVAYAYNLRGLITNLLDAAGSLDLVYDKCDRLTSATAANMALTMTYCTNSDERASLTLAMGGADVLTLDYIFGTAGRLAALRVNQPGGSVARSLTFRYDWYTNENRIAAICAPNGLTNQYLYQTNADLVAAIRVWGAAPAQAPLLAYTYAYDDANRCTNFARPYESRRDLYAYDPAGALVKAQRQVTGVWSTAQWYFDTSGNRVAETNGITGRVATNLHNALNQLRACSYDLDGNLTANGAWSYTWDAENRLTSAASNGTLIATYQYDSQNRRISKTVGTTTHTYLYDGWNLVAETISNPQFTITNLFVWGADHTGSLAIDSGGVRGLLAIISGSSVYYPVMNNHGDVMALFDATGTNIVARYERDPFGVLLSATGPAADACPFGFQTKYCDPETGLIYFGHRYYEPTLAAWLCRDPLEEEGGVNLYGVTGGDPVNGIDPLGLADLENHVVVGYFALREQGISLSLEEFECFARGLILPDLPFADAGGNATKLGEVPLAIAWVAQMEAAKTMKEATKLLEQKKKQIKQQYPLLDFNYWRNWTPAGVQQFVEKAGEPYRRTKYWWGDSGMMGPVLTRVPKLRDTVTIRTHFGDLAYYHGMGLTGGSAKKLQNNIQTTVDSCLNNYRSLKDTDRRRALLNLGMAVHILTDTWTPGHAQRDGSGSITLFQDYNVQSLHFHAYNDDLFRNMPQAFNSAIAQSALLIRQANGNDPVNTGVFFAIAPDAGIGIVAGTEQATLLKTLLNGIPGGGK